MNAATAEAGSGPGPKLPRIGVALGAESDAQPPAKAEKSTAAKILAWTFTIEGALTLTALSLAWKWWRAESRADRLEAELYASWREARERER